jgi:hypothetical protein
MGFKIKKWRSHFFIWYYLIYAKPIFPQNAGKLQNDLHKLNHKLKLCHCLAAIYETISHSFNSILSHPNFTAISTQMSVSAHLFPICPHSDRAIRTNHWRRNGN